MLIVTNIDYMRVEGDYHTIMKLKPYSGQKVTTSDGMEMVSTESVQTEIIQGQMLHMQSKRYGKEEIVIGVSAQVERGLDMYMKYFDSTQLQAEIATKKTKQLLKASLWTRIKWVFTGVNNEVKS